MLAQVTSIENTWLFLGLVHFDALVEEESQHLRRAPPARIVRGRVPPHGAHVQQRWVRIQQGLQHVQGLCSDTVWNDSDNFFCAAHTARTFGTRHGGHVQGRLEQLVDLIGRTPFLQEVLHELEAASQASIVQYCVIAVACKIAKRTLPLTF